MNLFKNIPARLILFVFLAPLALMLAFVPENTTKPYKLTAQQLLQEVNEGIQFTSPDDVAKLIVSQDPTILLVDVRSADEFENFHLEGAINIPLTDLLNPEWESYLDQDVRTNIFYCNGSTKSNQAWMITRQLGYRNCLVMQGGLNYWFETIMNPTAPGDLSADDMLAKYDFRKGASKVFGGGATEALAPAAANPKPLPAIVPKPAKKKIKGGC